VNEDVVDPGNLPATQSAKRHSNQAKRVHAMLDTTPWLPQYSVRKLVERVNLNQQYGRTRCLPTLSGNRVGVLLRLPHAFTPLPEKKRALTNPFWNGRRERHPGAILLVQTPQTNFLGALGWADVKTKNSDATEHEFDRSITKMFTGANGLQLERDGLLKTDSSLRITSKVDYDHMRIATGSRAAVLHMGRNLRFLDNPRWILR